MCLFEVFSGFFLALVVFIGRLLFFFVYAFLVPNVFFLGGVLLVVFISFLIFLV
ncbi:MAG: hypothetical protein FD143_2930 [Ignavibacteria bacterium]|nr:MAG: hypothetical protein FD143_2930 [Ignavibacteria bacterium]